MKNTSTVMVTDICERFGQKTQISMVAYRSNIRQKDRHFDFELTNFTCFFLTNAHDFTNMCTLGASWATAQDTRQGAVLMGLKY